MSTFLNNDIKYTVGKTALPCLDPTPEKKKEEKKIVTTCSREDRCC